MLEADSVRLRGAVLFLNDAFSALDDTAAKRLHSPNSGLLLNWKDHTRNYEAQLNPDELLVNPRQSTPFMEQIELLLQSVSPRNRKAVELRYSFDGIERTLDQAAKAMQPPVTRERIRQQIKSVMKPIISLRGKESKTLLVQNILQLTGRIWTPPNKFSHDRTGSLSRIASWADLDNVPPTLGGEQGTNLS